MKKTNASLILGMAAVAVTVILYFAILGNIFLELIHFITLLGVILSEVTVTAFFYFSGDSPRKEAAASVSVVLIPVSVILSLLYITNFPQGYGSYIGWFSALYILIIVGSVVLFRIDDVKNAENNAVQEAKGRIMYMRKLVKCIMAEPAAQEYKKALYALEEKLHYSNDSIIMPEDESIVNEINSLQDNISDAEYDIAAQIEKIVKMVDRRNIMTK